MFVFMCVFVFVCVITYVNESEMSTSYVISEMPLRQGLSLGSRVHLLAWVSFLSSFGFPEQGPLSACTSCNNNTPPHLVSMGTVCLNLGSHANNILE